MAEGDKIYRLAIIAPGHFHAGLILRQQHPRLDETIHIYAPEGPEVENFFKLVESFNTRSDAPTRWRLHSHIGPDWLERAIADKAADIAVIAGRNDGKAALIQKLHQAGFAVSADKPMLINSEDLSCLEEALASQPAVLELMAGRHAPANRILTALAGSPKIFGQWRGDQLNPAIMLKSTHHLYKVVNGAPVVRPAWYFNTAVQGEGILDVTTHLVDTVQGLAPGTLKLSTARQWPTQVPRKVFEEVTGLHDFPPSLVDCVENDCLALLCNADLAFRAGDVPVAIKVLWGLREPPDSGDFHYATMTGSRAVVSAVAGPETGGRTRITLRPVTGETVDPAALKFALGETARVVPMDDGYSIEIAESAQAGHDELFAMAFDHFLNALENRNAQIEEANRCLAKYRLLTKAKALSRQENPGRNS